MSKPKKKTTKRRKPARTARKRPTKARALPKRAATPKVAAGQSSEDLCTPDVALPEPEAQSHGAHDDPTPQDAAPFDREQAALDIRDEEFPVSYDDEDPIETEQEIGGSE